MEHQYDLNFKFSPPENKKTDSKRTFQIVLCIVAATLFFSTALVLSPISTSVPAIHLNAFSLENQSRNYLAQTFADLRSDNYKEQLFQLQAQNIYTTPGYNDMLESITHNLSIANHFNAGDTLQVNSHFKNSPPWVQNWTFGKGKETMVVHVPVSFTWTTPEKNTHTENRIAVLTFKNDGTNQIENFSLINTDKVWQ